MKRYGVPVALALILGGAVGLSSGAPAPDPVSAARGGTPGGPGDGDGEVPDFGDLIILLRDEHGVPIPSPATWVPDPETGQMVDGGLCWQPIAAVDFSYDGWDVPDPLARVVTPTVSTPVEGGYLIPVDQYNCAVEAYFAPYTQEVDFGRINEARSSVAVFESQLEDVVIKLATADSTSLDAAGRMVASTCGVDEVTTTGTIDSPLQNLAIYRQLMLTGSIGAELPPGASVLDTMARGVGVASDKGGEVNVDMIVYLNQLMGLDVAQTILPTLTQTYREEVQGTIRLVTKSFVDYAEYDYGRGANFGGLPFPAYVPDGAPQAGTFEYLAVLDPATPSFQIVRGPIMAAVFADQPGFTGGGIGGFAQAADDTRAVIDFMHDWPIPDADVFGTPVPCSPDPELITYDVSISDVSGLQVPTQMVDGSEGREFIVTVANAGPDAATGTVMVTATAANGVPIQGSPWSFDFALAAGTSQGFTQLFTVDLGERTTVDWTAVADAEFDVNLGNNTVTATTTVRVTGGGGRP